MESLTGWLGDIRAEVSDGVDASIDVHDDRLTVLTLRATRDLTGVATGEFANPSNFWTFTPAPPDGSVGFGYQYTEFGMPTIADGSLQGWFFFPARPSLVLPMMLIAPDERTLLLAPLSGFHEQVGAVDGRVRIGWHGDLDVVPEGFTTELALWSASSPRAALAEWGAELQQRYRTVRPGRYDDDLGRHPSYWTDNGTAYWYKTEPDRTTTETLVDTVADLRARDVPFSTVQLDSWWYPHQVLRPFNTDEWVVPPTGLMRWEPRDDVVPEGIAALRTALGDPPLAAHCRHLSSQSPYLGEFGCWVDGDRAHPKGPELYERWLDQCVEWGVETFEHDWLIEAFLGVRGLREEPGRARAWQEGIDRAAGRRNITLQWCMPSPADICQTVTLNNVTSIRTSGDHGYLVSAGYLWAWFLYTNALAGALGLVPYKDVFHTRSEHAEVEALLSALSTGPVGIGDRLGEADPAVVRRCCRADGVLVKPDAPIAAIDRGFRKWATSRGQLLTATTHSGAVQYVVTLNCTNSDASGRVEPGIEGRSVVWDWRTQTCEVVEAGGGWDVSLPSLGWDYRVVAPIVDGVAVIGDPALYATAGDLRIHHVAGDTLTVVGPNDAFDLVWWTEAAGVQRHRIEIGDVGWANVSLS
ncbi:MAG TPA: hypothetical protein VHD87_01175 [Acidimicrobiales bacterium]|nr:hypothetical protein [Acidimicrobiales bacterium]